MYIGKTINKQVREIIQSKKYKAITAPPMEIAFCIISGKRNSRKLMNCCDSSTRAVVLEIDIFFRIEFLLIETVIRVYILKNILGSTERRNAPTPELTKNANIHKAKGKNIALSGFSFKETFIESHILV